MFACFQEHVDIKTPTHLSIIPDPSWLTTTQNLNHIFAWCLNNNIQELSFFAWPMEFWETQNIELLNAFICKQTPNKDISIQLVSSFESNLNLDVRLKFNTLNTATPKLKVYIFISYSFLRDLTKVEYASQIKTNGSIPSSMSDPEMLIFTGGKAQLNNFCMAHLTKTCFLSTKTLFSHMDHEVMDDFVTLYSEHLK